MPKPTQNFSRQARHDLVRVFAGNLAPSHQVPFDQFSGASQFLGQIRHYYFEYLAHSSH